MQSSGPYITVEAFEFMTFGHRGGADDLDGDIDDLSRSRSGELLGRERLVGQAAAWCVAAVAASKRSSAVAATRLCEPNGSAIGMPCAAA